MGDIGNRDIGHPDGSWEDIGCVCLEKRCFSGYRLWGTGGDWEVEGGVYGRCVVGCYGLLWFSFEEISQFRGCRLVGWREMGSCYIFSLV